MKPVATTTILSDAKVRALTDAVCALLPPSMSFHTHAVLRIEASIRLRAVAEMTSERRMALQHTIPQVATSLKVPQYRLRAIESGQLSEMRASVVSKYVAYLELDIWFAKWLRANRVLAAEMGLGPRRQ